jgi:hypothetical protein
MREIASVTGVHIIEGRPWKDALISVVEPRSPYRPWHAADGIEPGDAIIAVLDTDPRSVLAGVGIVGPDGDVDEAIAAIDRFHLSGLLELGTLNMLTGFAVRPTAGTVYYRSPDDVVAVISAHLESTTEALFGHTSLAAGRVLLESGGNCTGCRLQLDLTREDARDRVHIHTADPPGHRPADPDLYDPADWPAALCDSCHDRMREGGFTSFVDFRFALHPRCPVCLAQRSRATMYGMPLGPVEEPWIAAMGCCVQPWEWLCGVCGHQW